MTSPIRPTDRRRRRDRGQSLVEFALVVPLFFLLVFAVFDFGFAMFARMTVQNATREGARAALLYANGPDADPIAIPDAANSTVTANDFGLGVVPTTTCLRSNATISCSIAEQGDRVRVQSDYTYHTIFPLLFGATFDLSSSVQMVLE